MFQDFSRHPERFGSRDSSWNPGTIELENLVILEMKHVSKGSWQPILLYKKANSGGNSSRDQSQ